MSLKCWQVMRDGLLFAGALALVLWSFGPIKFAALLVALAAVTPESLSAIAKSPPPRPLLLLRYYSRA